MEKTCTYAIGRGFFQFLLPAPRTLSTLVEILFLIYDIYRCFCLFVGNGDEVKEVSLIFNLVTAWKG